MRVSKTMTLALCLLLLNGTLSACNLLRTPYEREKINEAGGSLKKASKGNEAQAGDAGGGGGGGQKEPKKKPEQVKRADKRKAETLSERKEREKGTGLLYSVPKALENITPQLRYSQPLSAETSKVEGVEGATVLLDEKHNAYVALFSDNPNKQPSSHPQKQTNSKLRIQAVGDLPKQMQTKVAAQLRKADPLIGTVHLTNDKSHVESMQRYARQYANGSQNNSSKALAEHIEDIWK